MKKTFVKPKQKLSSPLPLLGSSSNGKKQLGITSFLSTQSKNQQSTTDSQEPDEIVDITGEDDNEHNSEQQQPTASISEESTIQTGKQDVDVIEEAAPCSWSCNNDASFKNAINGKTYKYGMYDPQNLRNKIINPYFDQVVEVEMPDKSIVKRRIVWAATQIGTNDFEKALLKNYSMCNHHINVAVEEHVTKEEMNKDEFEDWYFCARTAKGKFNIIPDTVLNSLIPPYMNITQIPSCNKMEIEDIILPVLPPTIYRERLQKSVMREEEKAGNTSVTELRGSSEGTIVDTTTCSAYSRKQRDQICAQFFSHLKLKPYSFYNNQPYNNNNTKDSSTINHKNNTSEDMQKLKPTTTTATQTQRPNNANTQTSKTSQVVSQVEISPKKTLPVPTSSKTTPPISKTTPTSTTQTTNNQDKAPTSQKRPSNNISSGDSALKSQKVAATSSPQQKLTTTSPSTTNVVQKQSTLLQNGKIVTTKPVAHTQLQQQKKEVASNGIDKHLLTKPKSLPPQPKKKKKEDEVEDIEEFDENSQAIIEDLDGNEEDEDEEEEDDDDTGKRPSNPFVEDEAEECDEEEEEEEEALEDEFTKTVSVLVETKPVSEDVMRKSSVTRKPNKEQQLDEQDDSIYTPDEDDVSNDGVDHKSAKSGRSGGLFSQFMDAGKTIYDIVNDEEEEGSDVDERGEDAEEEESGQGLSDLYGDGEGGEDDFSFGFDTNILRGQNGKGGKKAAKSNSLKSKPKSYKVKISNGEESDTESHSSKKSTSSSSSKSKGKGLNKTEKIEKCMDTLDKSIEMKDKADREGEKKGKVIDKDPLKDKTTEEKREMLSDFVSWMTHCTTPSKKKLIDDPLKNVKKAEDLKEALKSLSFRNFALIYRYVVPPPTEEQSEDDDNIVQL